MNSVIKNKFLKFAICLLLALGCISLLWSQGDFISAFAQTKGTQTQTLAANANSDVVTLTTGSSTITKPTAAEIVQRYESIPAYSTTRFVVEPSVKSPYSLGSLPAATLNNGEAWLNFMRYVANLPSISLTDALNESAQYGAVVMAANNKLTHYPTQPTDMEKTFFDQGYYACTSSNIAYKGYAPLSSFDSKKTGVVADAVQAWMDDEDPSNISAVGHRRWILNPGVKTMGLGSADTTGVDDNGIEWGYSYTALRALNQSGSGYAQVDASGSVDYEAIAWPASGDFPSSVFATDVPWSITLNPSKWETPSASDVVVTLKDTSTNKAWTLRNGGSEGDFYIDTQGSGVANCIIFRPSNLTSTKMTGTWEVSISGLKKKGQTTSTTAQYSVNFIDTNDISAADIKIDTTNFTYTGWNIHPTFTVVLGGKTLSENTDYTVTCINDKNAGTATATITGIGNYSGSVEREFTISKASLNIAYKGETITFGDTPQLKLEYDHFVSGENESVLTTPVKLEATNANVGEYTLTPSGASASNYDITYSGGVLKIEPRDIATATSSTVVRQPYTGSAITPAIDLTFRGVSLKQGEDYAITYKNNVEVGTATIEITGQGNFSGTITKSFEIYDSSEPSVNVGKVTGSGTIKINGKTLAEGEGISYAEGENINLSWTSAQVGSKNLTLVKSIKVNGVDQVAQDKIDKTKWQVANSAYRNLMNDSSAMMTTYAAVSSAENSLTLGALNATAGSVTSVEVEFGEYVPVYRLYNMSTSEHLFTTNKTEYDNFVTLCEQGKDVWIGEGIDWFAEVTPAAADTNTVRRFYNAALGAMGRSSHYYSKDPVEIETLKASGWVDDGADNYIQSGGSVPIWTCYNEGLGSAHHYTSNKTEWEGLDQHGWALEKDKNLDAGVFQAVMSAKP